MGQIATFYSYKGGVGRTMSLANVAVLLVKWGYKVLIVDWDLEAPGLEFYFKDYVDLPEVTRRQGIVDLLSAAAEAAGSPQVASSEPNGLSDILHRDLLAGLSSSSLHWRDCLTKIPLPVSSQSLHLISAGERTDASSYYVRLRDLDLKSFYLEKRGGHFIENMRNEWIEVYDFVLVDSRTGVTDIGGICTVQLPDLLLLHFTANEQSLQGAIRIAEKAATERYNLPFDRLSLVSVPVPTRFDTQTEFKISQSWIDIFARRLGNLYADWLPESVSKRRILDLTKIPYVSYFSFGEKLPVIEQGSSDPAGLGYAYETLSAIIAHNLESIELLEANRDEFVRSVDRTSRRKEIEAGTGLAGVAVKPPDEPRPSRDRSSEVLSLAWERYGLYDQNASIRRQRSTRIQYSIILVSLITVAVIVAVFSLGDYFENYLPFDTFYRLSIIGLTIFILTIQVLAAQFWRDNTWSLLQASAEAVKKEIYLYRAGVGDYFSAGADLEPAEVKLARSLENIQKNLMNVLVNESSLAPGDGPIPDYLGGDDGVSRLAADAYVKWRLRDQINVYRARIARYEGQQRRLRLATYLFSGASVFLAATGLDIWVVLTITISIAIYYWLEARRFGETIASYNQIAADLENIYTWWITLPEEARLNPDNHERLVESTEDVLSVEYGGYMQEMRQALKELIGKTAAVPDMAGEISRMKAERPPVRKARF